MSTSTKTKDAIRLRAKKKKTGEPYTFVVANDHMEALVTLEVLPGISDHELTYLSEYHQIASARCRMRDAGMVEQVGRNAHGMTWRLTAEGHRFLAEARAKGLIR